MLVLQILKTLIRNYLRIDSSNDRVPLLLSDATASNEEIPLKEAKEGVSETPEDKYTSSSTSNLKDDYGTFQEDAKPSGYRK